MTPGREPIGYASSFFPWSFARYRVQLLLDSVAQSSTYSWKCQTLFTLPMDWFLEKVATPVSQVIASIKEDFQQGLKPEAHRGRDVAIYTNAAFAQFDLGYVGLDWDASNDGVGEVPETIRKQALEGVEDIKIKLAGKIRSSDEAIARARSAAKTAEELSENLKPKLGFDSNYAANTSISESNLNAIELLEESVRKCLQLLFSTLARQLDCCDGNHFVRLRLSGFINQFDHQSRSIFDLFLSSGHDCKRSHWVASRCTFARYAPCFNLTHIVLPNYHTYHSPDERTEAVESSKSRCQRIRL